MTGDGKNAGQDFVSNTLIDCGAQGRFIDKKLALKKEIVLTRLNMPVTPINVDVTENKSEKIEYVTSFSRMTNSLLYVKQKRSFLKTVHYQNHLNFAWYYENWTGEVEKEFCSPMKQKSTELDQMKECILGSREENYFLLKEHPTMNL